MWQKQLSTITIITVILATLSLGLTAFAAVNVTQTINSSGSITVSPNLGIYSDSACTVPMTSIDWGSITPGEAVTKTVYVKNIQGAASLTLSMTANNWNPSTANGPLTVTWNRQGTVLAPGQSTAATLTLTVSSSVTTITSFSVQIAIVGTA